MSSGAAGPPVTVTVCPVDDLPDGAVRLVQGAGRALAVCRVDGTLFAIDDACLHKGASLAGGRLVGPLLECPSHWWRYDVRTGERAGSPGVCLATYPARVQDGLIVVEVPPAPPVRSLREVLLAHARGEDGPGS